MSGRDHFWCDDCGIEVFAPMRVDRREPQLCHDCAKIRADKAKVKGGDADEQKIP